MAGGRSYKDDEVRAIIDRALNKETVGGVTHEDLLAIGAGVGLSRAALESAALEVQETRLKEAAAAHVISRRRRGVAAHAFVFFAVNTCLFLINALTTPGEWWALFPLFGWGLGLLLHAGFALTKAVSPARLNRERRRLERRAEGDARGVSAASAAKRGVRVADAEQPEQPEQSANQTAEGDAPPGRAR